MVDMGKILDDIVAQAGYGSDKSMRSDMAANAGLLDRKQFNTFIRDIEMNQTILKDAAFQRMTQMTEVTSGTQILGRVLQDGYKADGTTNPELTPATVGFGYDELVAKKLKAVTSIEDDDLEDNIEREAFQTTLLSMMADRMGSDLEAIAVFGDSTLDRTTQPLFHTFDGWIKKSTNKLESSELATGDGDFNVHENTIEAMFDAILRKIPANIRQSNLMNEFVFYVPWEVEDAYRNLLKSRNTNLGDAMQTGAAPLFYKKYPVKYAPVLDATDARAIDNTATTIGAFPSLLKWGVYKDVKLEPERKPDIETTRFWYRMRGCAGLRVYSSLITAKLTAAEVEVIQDEAKE